ncbi:g6164 [Coccomyxa elongata]
MTLAFAPRSSLRCQVPFTTANRRPGSCGYRCTRTRGFKVNAALPVEDKVQQSLSFVAMNNFKVKPECCTDFENVWKNRNSTLLETPGFIRFALLKGDEEGEYISQSVWATRQDFNNWRESQKFAQAHGGGGGEDKPVGSAAPKTGDMLMGRPVAKFYEAVTMTEQTFF